MNNNEMTYALAREIVLEGMIENIMDDHDVDYDVALAMITKQAVDLEEGIAEILASHNA